LICKHQVFAGTIVLALVMGGMIHELCVRYIKNPGFTGILILPKVNAFNSIYSYLK
jgi:hypothetical protein